MAAEENQEYLSSKTFDLLVHEIQSIRKTTETTDQRLGVVEKAMSTMAVQSEQIHTVQNQVNALWTKYDTQFGPGGSVSLIRDHQQQCPKGEIGKIWTSIYGVLALFATILVITIMAFQEVRDQQLK
jgi:hypothetical protein